MVCQYTLHEWRRTHDILDALLQRLLCNELRHVRKCGQLQTWQQYQHTNRKLVKCRIDRGTTPTLTERS